MQGRHQYQPELFSVIDIEHLIPKNHLLRRIDKVLNLSFLAELTAPLYAEAKGRPSIDPEVFIRMVLLGYLYNVDSDRQLCEEVGYNLAYRWFARLSLKDSVPDHSSMTKICDRLGEKIYAEIFSRVLNQCKDAGLVKLDQIMVDGSVIKANASIYNMEERKKPQANNDDDPPGPIHSQDGLSSNDFRKRQILGTRISNKTHVSCSDPDATLSGKKGEMKALAYKTHSAIDAGSRVIIDCHVTTGSVSDVTVFIDRMKAIQEKMQMKIGEVVADRGYGAAENLEFLAQEKIKSTIPLWSTRTGQSLFTDLEKGFRIDSENAAAYCPAGHKMKRRGRDQTHGRDKFEMFPNICTTCPMAASCLTEKENRYGKKTFYVSDSHKVWIDVHGKQMTSTIGGFRAPPRSGRPISRDCAKECVGADPRSSYGPWDGATAP